MLADNFLNTLPENHYSSHGPHQVNEIHLLSVGVASVLVCFEDAKGCSDH